MQLSQGYSKTTNKVCKIKKSLYGLKQASRQWFTKLVQELIHKGYNQSKNDYSLFTKRAENSITIIAIYVDDIILTGNTIQEINNIKAHLNSVFSIKDLGKLHFFLGMEVNYLQDGIVISQHKFAKDHLKDYHHTSTRKALTPLPLHIKLSTLDGELLADPTPYRSMVGKLNFLTNTRPYWAYAIQTLSQFMQNPRETHWQALQHTLSYVSNTCGQGILLKASNKISI